MGTFSQDEQPSWGDVYDAAERHRKELANLKKWYNDLADVAMQSLDRTEASREALKKFLVALGERRKMVERGIKS